MSYIHGKGGIILDFETVIDLQGNEFITTLFHEKEDAYMILALGDNLDGTKVGPSFIFLYLCIDGEIEYGINTFVFMKPEEASAFINELPTMSAMDFIIKGTSISPSVLT